MILMVFTQFISVGRIYDIVYHSFSVGCGAFFFNVTKDADAKTKLQDSYALVYSLGSLLMVAVMIFIDVIADILLRQQEYKQDSLLYLYYC